LQREKIGVEVSHRQRSDMAMCSGIVVIFVVCVIEQQVDSAFVSSHACTDDFCKVSKCCETFLREIFLL
jgi:hypothetical protein